MCIDCSDSGRGEQVNRGLVIVRARLLHSLCVLAYIMEGITKVLTKCPSISMEDRILWIALDLLK